MTVVPRATSALVVKPVLLVRKVNLVPKVTKVNLATSVLKVRKVKLADTMFRPLMNLVT